MGVSGNSPRIKAAVIKVYFTFVQNRFHVDYINRKLLD